MEAVGVDDPPGDVTVFNEGLGGLGGHNSLLHARAFAGWAAPSEQAVVLDVEVKFDILGNCVNTDVGY